MTVFALWRRLTWAVLTGRGGADVYFNTEARSFPYHLARIGSCAVDRAVAAHGMGDAVVLVEAP